MKSFATACTLIALCLIAASSTRALTAADQKFLTKKIIARWEVTGKNQIAAAYARGVDILEEYPSYSKGSFTVLVDADELASLRADGYTLTVEDDDWYRHFAAKSAASMGGFKSWAQGVAFLDSLHTAFPGITTAKFSIGMTSEARQIWAIKISDSPDVDEAEPEVLFDALHHAREPITCEVLYETMRSLCRGYGSDSLMTYFVNNREIYFVPFVNPDGYEYNRSMAPNGGGMWRKNRNSDLFPQIGVDNNRNYDEHWGYDNLGSSPDPDNETYRGSSAASELETQAMQNFIDGREFVFQNSYHSVASLFLWPPGYDYVYTPDQALFAAIGDSVVTFNHYTPEPVWGLYLTNGTAIEWSYAATANHTKVLGFTTEVGGGSFWPDSTLIPSLVAENLGPNWTLIDLADQPERIFAPVVPNWVETDSASAGDYRLSWSDPGGLNGAVSFRLREVVGLALTVDGAETGGPSWTFAGFNTTTARKSSGAKSYYSGTGNGLTSRMSTSTQFIVPTNDTLKAKLWYDTETDWDYVYVEASTDNGQSWTTLPGNLTTNSNPTGRNRGNGITGTNGSGGVFVNARFPLNSYAGQSIAIRLSYETDGFVFGEGAYFDEISPVLVFDSVVTLAQATPDDTFHVAGKLPGTYWYDLRSTDQHGQVSKTTAPHSVVVDYVPCVCNCHSDPVCDAATNIQDVVKTIDIAFRGTAPIADDGCSHGPAGRTDVNCDSVTSILDVVKMVNVAFRSANPTIEFCNPCNVGG